MTSRSVIRLFMDLGPDLVPLLNRLELDEAGLRFVGRIQAGFVNSSIPQPLGEPEEIPSEPAVENQRGLIDPLSKRELEVLGLLAGQLTNKEIGEALFISPGTVKRHTHSIYDKLAVGSRREAVAKAKGLGILR